MTPPVYTIVMIEGGFTGGGVEEASIPSGVVWIVREINIITGKVPDSGLTLEMFAPSTTFYHQIFPPGWSGTKVQHRRTAIPGGGVMGVTCVVDPFSPGLQYKVTGYQLSLP